MSKQTKKAEIAELLKVRAYIDKRLKELAPELKTVPRPDKAALMKKYSALRK